MGIGSKIWQFALVRNVTYILGASVFLFIALLIFLRVYTQHGQKLILPEYVGMLYDEASDIAKKNDYQLIIDDSVHIVGKPGGEILSQNPRAGSGVKAGRKVYVTIAKFNPDVFMSSQLPELYGKRYDLKAQELATLFKLDCKIIGYKYDPGPKDHILEVQYQGKPIENKNGKNGRVEIARGDQMGFVLSKRDGGQATVPELSCKTLGEAEFLVSSARLTIGKVQERGEITDRTTAYIIVQDPPSGGAKVAMGSPIELTIVQEKPEGCL
jgi:beta-lactam-binding protein with PASTA domain